MARFARAAALAIGAASALTVLHAARAQAQRKRLTGQVVLITGGSRGFGLALAREFGRLHCRIALCARSAAELLRAHADLTSRGHEVFTVVCDISHRDQVSTMIEAVNRRYGHIDILVNNAGEIMVSPLENLDVADFERSMAVIFWGTLYTTLGVLPGMKAKGRGRIVNVTSIGGKVSVPHLLSYSCAKAAAVAFSDGLRSEVRQFGIDVTTIIPGLMRTGSHVNASFKGDHIGESSWFSAAASLPLLSLSAEHAARLTVKGVCAGKAECVIGLPAQLLTRVQTLSPQLTAELLRLSNSMLPKGTRDDATISGGDLEAEHGSLHRLLTTLGKRAGEELNQPV